MILKNYKELLNLLKVYQKIKVWEKISGDDVFQIQGYKKPIYVAILGQAKICNEINIYMNKEELYEQYDTIYGEYYKYPDIYYRVSCYKLIVEKAEELLTSESQDILRKNHIKKDMAILRIERGKMPRLVTEDEAEFLIPIMRDIIKISEYIIEKNLVFPEKIKLDEQYAFSVKEKVSCRKKKFESGHEICEQATEIDQDILNKVLIFSQKGTFGIGLFYGPFYIEKEKEYCRLLIVSDLETGKVLEIQAIPQKEAQNLANCLLATFLKIKRYPQNIAFASTRTLLRCQKLISELKMNYKVDIEMDELFNQWLAIREYVQNQK